MTRIASLFSCGEPSAVMTRILIAEARRVGDDLAIIRCVVPLEHPDNDRFAAGCQRWFGHPITNLASEDYADCWDVWERRRYLNGHAGAPCTLELKKLPRLAWEREWQPDVIALGYTVEEQKRARMFVANNPEYRVDFPLIRAGLSAADCAGIVANAGIERPAMYRLGFKHNNCRTCVKARSPGYWAAVRLHFPDVFARMAALSRDIGWTPCRASDDAPIWLDELPLDTRVEDDSAGIECSLFCAIAEQKIAEVAP